MAELNGTGVKYPTIKVGDAEYEVKFTRGVLYRLEKAGVIFNPRFTNGGKTWTLSFSNVVDVLHACIDFNGTHEQLAELIFDTRDVAANILMEAWGNLMLPSTKRRAAAATAQRQAEAAEAPPASEKPV